jgi:hypothetical protein
MEETVEIVTTNSEAVNQQLFTDEELRAVLVPLKDFVLSIRPLNYHST